MSDDFLDSSMKIRIRGNDANHDSYRKNGGFLNQYSVASPSQSASDEASSPNAVERVPRLLFSLRKKIILQKLFSHQTILIYDRIFFIFLGVHEV